MVLRTEAIILKSWKLGETSKIVLLYTRDYGRIKVVAKGARKPKSQFNGCLEPLSRTSIIYYDKPNRDLQLLSKADLIDPHYQMIGDILKTSLSLAVIELLNRAVGGEEPFPAVYDLVSRTLDLINESAGQIEGFFWFFVSHFIIMMGYRPNWDSCLICQCSLRDEGGIFQAARGGLFCRQCTSGEGGQSLSGDTLEILYWLQTSQPEEAAGLKPTARQKTEIRQALKFYISTHLEHIKKLRALEIFYDYQRKE